MEKLINLFGGSGFVGGKYEELTPNILCQMKEMIIK